MQYARGNYLSRDAGIEEYNNSEGVYYYKTSYGHNDIIVDETEEDCSTSSAVSSIRTKAAAAGPGLPLLAPSV